MIVKVVVKIGRKHVDSVEKISDGLVVYISEKPVEGRANAVVVKLVAKHYGVVRNKVKIKSGFKSKFKLVEVDI